MNIEGLSLDQLRAVLGVVDAGSFSAAARKFGRAQSAVSYAVQQTEMQLGLDLFDRTGYRPQLTPAGRALVNDIRAIVARADDLTARAEAVSRGVEPEIVLAIDAICSPAALAQVLAEFQATFPTVSVRVHVETLGAVVERVLEGRGILGVIATLLDLPDGLARYAMPPVRMLSVAAPGHPLAAVAGEEAQAMIASAVQVVLSDRSRRTDGRDHAVLSPNTWRVNDIALKRELILAGVGWGCLSRWMVADDLREGRLVQIQAPSIPVTDDMATQAFHDAGHRPGPAMSWMISALRERGLD